MLAEDFPEVEPVHQILHCHEGVRVLGVYKKCVHLYYLPLLVSVEGLLYYDTADNLSCLSRNDTIFLSRFPQADPGTNSFIAAILLEFWSAKTMPLSPNPYFREGTENSEDREKPQDNHNDHDGIQD